MIEESAREQIKKTVEKYLWGTNYKIFIFGSRATSEHRPFSDIDLGILSQEKIPGHIMVRIEEELENSRIPYKVDVVDFKSVSPQFKNVALRKAVYL